MEDSYKHVPISFFMPVDRFPEVIPEEINPDQEGFQDDIYAWTLQTYFYLRGSGFFCALVKEMPEEGIIIAHRDCLVPDNYLQPNPNVLLVCIQSDRQRLSYAQIHVVQNPDLAKQITHGYFIPSWPTPALKPRDSHRGNRFENVVYLGHLNDLATELKQYGFRERLRSLGLKWEVKIHDYCDYRDVDVVLAVRNFCPEINRQTESFIHQSAIKLCDAWRAEVPTILGHECAYQFIGQPDLDYLAVNSVEDVVSTLTRLRDDPDFRQAIVRQGKISRSQGFDCQSLTDEWRSFLETVAIPSYQQWRSLSEVERWVALEQHKANIEQKNQVLELRQHTLSQLRADALPYDLSEQP
jgi:hypothetical protein